jgi:hypothetical protein
MRAASLNAHAFVCLITFVALSGLAKGAITGFGDFSDFTINKAPGDAGPFPQIFPSQDKIELTDNT